MGLNFGRPVRYQKRRVVQSVKGKHNIMRNYADIYVLCYFMRDLLNYAILRGKRQITRFRTHRVKYRPMLLKDLPKFEQIFSYIYKRCSKFLGKCIKIELKVMALSITLHCFSVKYEVFHRD